VIAPGFPFIVFFSIRGAGSWEKEKKEAKRERRVSVRLGVALNVLCVTDQSISSNRRSFCPKVLTGKGIKENECCEIKNDGKEGTGGIKERRRSRRDSGLRRVAVWAAGRFPRWFDTGCLDLI
jgi:hypothetical protein